MLNPYLLMALLYLGVSILGFLASSLSGLQWIGAIMGIKWLRVHTTTLGVLTQAVFGLAPYLAAIQKGIPKPRFRWDIWFLLNSGLLVLLAGIPTANGVLITSGGTLIFAAIVLLFHHLYHLGPVPSSAPSLHSISGSRRFYAAGLGYLLIGVLVGSGMWQAWGGVLSIKAPLEVHVHTNLWGFTALVFAGLFVDLYPVFTGRSLAWPRSVPLIFWLMVLGAGGLVAGPWLGVNALTVVGLVVHTLGTVWLLAAAIKPILKELHLGTPGVLHMITAYFWVLIPVVVAPMIVARATNFPTAQIAGSGGPILIFGWILPFLYAVLPYWARRAFLPDQPSRPGGSWISLTAAHAGSILFWASLFFPGIAVAFRALAYLFWIAAGLSPALEMWRSVREGLKGLEDRS